MDQSILIFVENEVSFPLSIEFTIIYEPIIVALLDQRTCVNNLTVASERENLISKDSVS